MPLSDTEKLIEYYNRCTVDAWNQTHPAQKYPIVYEECEIDPEDRRCEMIAMPFLVNKILDELVSEVRSRGDGTIGDLRARESFIMLIDQVRPKVT